MRDQSFLMRLFRFFKLNKIAWSLRRLYVPCSKSDLVLEVGSGGNPFPRANVLLDAYEDTQQRHWVPLKIDRPMVLGFVERLPFKDKSFDFTIACHVLEHSANPEQFLRELMRVGKAGYIESPDAFMERINPYRDHRLEVTERNGGLIIKKKESWNSAPDLVELYEYKAKKIIATQTISQNPFDFHVRFYWKDSIEYEVTNPDVDSGWEAIVDNERQIKGSARFQIRGVVSDIAARVLRKAQKNRKINFLDLLQCPTCSESDFVHKIHELKCRGCGCIYQIINNVPRMFPKNSI